MTIETIKKVLSQNLDIDVETITEDSSFDDLGIDSLDAVELMMELEDEFGIELDAAEMGRTVRDLADYINAHAE